MTKLRHSPPDVPDTIDADRHCRGAAFAAMPDSGGLLCREVFDKCRQAVFVVAARPREPFVFEYMNPAARAAAGVSLQAIADESLEAVLGPQLASAWLARLLDCLAAGSSPGPRDDGTPARLRAGLGADLMLMRSGDGTIDRIVGICRDAPEDSRFDELRAERENYFHSLVENSPDVIVRYDRDCRRTYANRAYAKASKISIEDIMGTTPCELSAFEPQDARAYEARIRAVFETGQPEEIHCSIERDGATWHYWVRAVPEWGRDGVVASVLAIARDTTDRIAAERQLAKREREYRTLVENSPDFIARYDREARRLYVNPALRRRLGADALQLGARPTEVSPLKDPEAYASAIRGAFETGMATELEVAYRTAEGTDEWGHVRVTPEFDEDGQVVSVLTASHDITELARSRDRISRLAFYDPLTDLPNRSLLQRHIQELADGTGPAGFGFMMLDLDRFKDVNDTFGHAAGDELLREVARRLRLATQGRNPVFRLGGDEFAVLVMGHRDRADLTAVAMHLQRAFALPMRLAKREIAVSASIGIASYPADSRDPQEIMKKADAAMYAAKKAGRNGHKFFDMEMMGQVVHRLVIEGELRKALARGEFELHYQPQVLLASGRIVGAEALLRWRHPEIGLRHPEHFIAIAEETGLIVELGYWVMMTGCRAAAAWNVGRPQPLQISINLSPRQFAAGDLVTFLAHALFATGCKPEWLCLEITESLLLEDKENTGATLEAIRAMGVSIAIDDFGIGYSSLSYLSNFPIDVLKIDQSFTRDIGTDRKKTELTKAIIAIAKALDLKVVAEGVETEQQCAILAANGCRIVQGYLFGRPMPMAAMLDLAAA